MSEKYISVTDLLGVIQGAQRCDSDGDYFIRVNELLAATETKEVSLGAVYEGIKRNLTEAKSERDEANGMLYAYIHSAVQVIGKSIGKTPEEINEKARESLALARQEWRRNNDKNHH